MLPEPVLNYVELIFPEPPLGRPYMLLNMVASADGKAAVAGSERALSSPTDKLLLQALRVHAGAILNGSGTARSTGASPIIRDLALRELRRQRGRPEPPLQVILTRTARFDGNAGFLTRRDFSLVIFATDAASAADIDALRRSGRTVEIVAAGPGGLREMMTRLRTAYGVKLLLVEGGPALNASLFHAGLIDEFFLTVSPRIAAGASTITAVEGAPFDAVSMPNLRLISAWPNTDTNEVYLRWRVSYAGGNGR